MTNRRTRNAAAIFASVALGACSTINPYASADFDRSLNEVKRAAQQTDGPIPERLVNLRAGMAHGNDQIRIWRSKANLSSNLQTAIYGTAIGALGTAGYFGASGERGTSAITALTFAGSALFGWASLNNAKPRQQIYIAGTGAMTCLLYTRSALDLTNKELLDLENVQQLEAARRDADLARRELVAEGYRTVATLGGGTSVKTLIAPYLGASTNAGREIGRAVNALSEAQAFLTFVDAHGKNMRHAVGDLVHDVDEQLAKSQLTPEQAIAIASAVGSRARQDTTNLMPEKEETSDAESSAKAEEEDLISTAEQGQLRGSAQRADLEIAASRLNTKLAELNRSLTILTAETGKLAAIYEPRMRFYQEAANSDVCTPIGAALPLTIDPSDKTVTLKPGDPYAVSIKGGSGRYSSSLGGQVAGVTLEASGGVLAGDRVMVKTSDNASGAFSLTVRDLDTNQDVTIAFTIAEDSNNIRPKSQAGPTVTPGARPVVTDLPDAPDEELVGLPRATTTTLSIAAPQSSCVLTPTQTAISQLAFLAAEPSSIGPVGFVDGQWGPNTEKAARAWLVLRAKTSIAVGTDVRCGLKSIVRSRPELLRQLYRDAEGNRSSAAFYNAEAQSLSACVISSRQPIQSCIGAF